MAISGDFSVATDIREPHRCRYPAMACAISPRNPRPIPFGAGRPLGSAPAGRPVRPSLCHRRHHQRRSKATPAPKSARGMECAPYRDRLPKAPLTGLPETWRRPPGAKGHDPCRLAGHRGSKAPEPDHPGVGTVARALARLQAERPRSGRLGRGGALYAAPVVSRQAPSWAGTISAAASIRRIMSIGS